MQRRRQRAAQMHAKPPWQRRRQRARQRTQAAGRRQRHKPRCWQRRPLRHPSRCAPSHPIPSHYQHGMVQPMAEAEAGVALHHPLRAAACMHARTRSSRITRSSLPCHSPAPTVLCAALHLHQVRMRMCSHAQAGAWALRRDDITCLLASVSTLHDSLRALCSSKDHPRNTQQVRREAHSAWQHVT